MNEQEDYRRRFRSFVMDQIPGFYRGVGQFYLEQVGHTDSLVYFEQQFPRIWAMIKMLKKAGVAPRQTCELGSFYPYTSLYFGGSVDLYDIIPILYPSAAPYEAAGVRLAGLNLCTDSLPKKEYDLVILSEVLEHLPCDLLRLTRSVQDMVRSGGHIIVTYPMQYRNNAENYGDDIGDPARLHGGHLREFTEATTGLFFRELEIVDTLPFSYPAYGLVSIILYHKAV